MTRCDGTLKPSTCQRRAPRLELRTESVKFGSDTVHHQLENNPRAIPRDTDKRKRFPANHKQYHKGRNAHCRTSCRRQLLTQLCEATFAVTANTRSEHTLLARQNRCLQGVCKSSGAGVSHIVLPKT